MLGWLKILVKPGEAKNQTEQNLVLVVLGASLAATCLFYLTGASPVFMAILSLCLLVAIVLAWRGYVQLAGLLGTLAALIIFASLIFKNYGLRDTAILGLPTVIIAASLMNGRWGALIFGSFSLLIVLGLGVAEALGWMVNRSGLPNLLTDYMVVGGVIALTITLQWAVIERMRLNGLQVQQALAQAREAENALRQSEERYRLISEVSSDYVFSSEVNQAGILSTSWLAGAFESISGYTPEEYVAQGGWRATLHPDDLLQDERDLEQLRRNQKVVSELRVIAKDGTLRWVRVFARPVWDADENRLVGIYGAVQNITPQKLIDQALRQSDERYRTFIAQSTEGIRRYDFREPISIDLPEDEQVQRMLTEMYIAECNDAFAQMYGLSNASQLLGKNLSSLGLEHDPANLESLRQFIRSGYRIVDAESHEIDFQGRERYYLVNTLGMVENGCLVRAWGIQRDVTERKRAELEIHRLNEELEARVAQRTAQLESVNQELEAFSYSVSHDLRAPLRSINGFGQILLRDFGHELDPLVLNFIGKMITSAREMSELVDSLLEFSRLGRSELRRGPVDLSALALSILSDLHKAEPARVVTWQVAPGLVVTADETLLRNVLENLLGNAWKYTSKISPAEITLGQAELSGEKVFFVQDNGAGFEMQYADKLFGTFQRLHRADEFPGHGIGLATVQRILLRHGGRVWAQAKVGQGATFFFTLPDA